VWFAYAIDGDFNNQASFTKFEVLDQYNSNHALPSPTPLIIIGLADTTHTLMIVRRNEGNSGVISFTGFGLDPGKILSSPAPKTTRKMEFIGDSITCGSWNEWAGSNPCSDPYGGCIQNGYMAFGPQLARMYNAEGRTISRGGIGVYRNCPGCDPPPTIAAIYPNMNFEAAPAVSSQKWNFSSWQADVVVLALGTNDFSAGVPDQTAFEDAYSSFLTDVRADYPNAYILCTEPVPSWVNVAAGQYISQVVTNKADAKMFYVPLNNPAAAGFPLLTTEYAGDNTHPLIAAHTKIALALKTWIDANIAAQLGW
jgi:lysophospholipase L1-like esterase